MNWSHVVFCVNIVSFCITLEAVTQKPVVLDQLFLHKGNRVDRLVGYFTGKPVLQEPVINASDSLQRYTLILEHCKVSKKAQEKVNVITKQRKRDQERIAYTIQFEERDGNIHLIFTYNPARIEIATSIENSIKGVPTMVVSMYDKRYSQHNSISLDRPGVRVVIDCGHGGRDGGAMGVNGVPEKDITLAVGQKIGTYLEKYSFMPFIQRSSTRDVYIALDDRTTYANLTAYADIVISLHANSSATQATAQGLETYYLDAAGVRAKAPGALKQHEQQKEIESSKLARAIHGTLLGYDKKNRVPHDRGIKQALTQILLGVEAPAILIELGFVTNPEECALLNDPEYQDFLAQRIVQGIKNYFSMTLCK